MAPTWWGPLRGYIYVFHIILLCGQIALAAYIITKGDHDQSTVNMNRLLLAYPSLSMLWSIIYAFPRWANQTIVQPFHVCSAFLLIFSWFGLAVWTCFPATVCKADVPCSLIKSRCALTWLEAVFFWTCIFHPPDFVLWRSLVLTKLAEWRAQVRRLRTRMRRRILGLEDYFWVSTFRCGICMEDKKTFRGFRFAPCRHLLCRDCAKGYVSSRLEARELPILCPICVADQERAADSYGALDDILLERLSAADKLDTVLNQIEVDKVFTLVDCSRCERATYVSKEWFNNTKVIPCPSPGCPHVWCKSCIWSTDSPEEALRVHASCLGDAELQDLMARKGWKRCPGCQTPIERIAGCSHMTCQVPRCSTHFCWACGEAVPAAGFMAHNNVCQYYKNEA